MKINHIFTLSALLAASSAMAAEYVWTGDGGNNDYQNNANWLMDGSATRFYPQATGDNALIDTGASVVWNGEKDYYGATGTLTLTNASSVTMTKGGNALTPTTVKYEGSGTFAIYTPGTDFGVQRDATFQYGTFTKDAHGLTSVNTGDKGIWANNHTWTFTGTFDTTGIEGTDSITLVSYTNIDYGSYTPSETDTAHYQYSFTATGANAEYVTFGWDASGKNYVASWEGVPVAPVPEPATATLSLLALTGLAARRRRK